MEASRMPENEEEIREWRAQINSQIFERWLDQKLTFHESFLACGETKKLLLSWLNNPDMDIRDFIGISSYDTLLEVSDVKPRTRKKILKKLTSLLLQMRDW